MTKLEIAKEIIKNKIADGDCGIFDSRNIVGDTMITLYDRDGLTIDICYGWSYFEVFGLTDSEFSDLADYYDKIREEHWRSDNADNA